MTPHATPHPTSHATSRRAVRRVARVAVLAPVTALTALAAPAHADVPEGWSGITEERPIDVLETLLLFVGGPVLLFVLIMLAVYLPAMKRGEPLLPDHGAGEAQWIGGPRQGTKELPAPDGEGSRAGGASGRW